MKFVLVSLALMIASYYDLKYRIIPDMVCICIAVLGLINCNVDHWLGLSLAIPCLIVGLHEQMGGGDIKLIGALGFATGSLFAVPLLTISLLSLLLWHFMTHMKKGMHIAYPLAPFLCFGYLITCFLNY